MSFLELAKKRCSCRNFNDQQVPEETLQYILEAGRVAPTGVNKQPQHILVVRSKEGLAKMNEVLQRTDRSDYLHGTGCCLDKTGR